VIFTDILYVSCKAKVNGETAEGEVLRLCSGRGSLYYWGVFPFAIIAKA